VISGSHKTVYLDESGRPAAKTQMTVTLSADNRVISGEVAGAFLEAFKKNLSNPVRLLL
jgi:pyruvate dehydrogenase E2 component (dihydrolipoamide acetyltransferase)